MGTYPDLFKRPPRGFSMLSPCVCLLYLTLFSSLTRVRPDDLKDSLSQVWLDPASLPPTLADAAHTCESVRASDLSTSLHLSMSLDGYYLYSDISFTFS